jgi:hypothetical protein
MAREQLPLAFMADSVSVRSNARRRQRATLCCLCGLLIFWVSSAPAQDSRTSGRTEAAVALQPFSLDEPGHVRYAYYAPRTIPRAEAVTEADEPERPRLPQTIASGPIVRGKRALLRNGIAYAPANAPDNVKCAIWAANNLRGKPYVWGGGHGSFNDDGYDCSGTISFALHHAGLLGAPLPSSDFLRFGKRGRGRWITIYARPGHTFAVIAGLRLDTTDLRYGTDVGPRWHTDFRSPRGFDARHPEGL